MRHPEGLIGWTDLMTTDVESARSFYEGLFGWTSEILPTPMGVDYTQFRLGGDVVCGMGPVPPDALAAGMPSMWTSYALVSDADATCAAAEAAGGTVTMPVMDVMDQGRMAMITDPGGGTLGLWQPMKHEGAEVFNAPGSMTWNEISTRALQPVMDFYSSVFGWRWTEDPPGGGYWVCNLDTKAGDDPSNGGAMAVPSGVPDEMPSMWFTYFRVDDVAQTIERARELGGSVSFDTMPMGPGEGAGLIDPTGAMFNVIAFKQ